MRNIMICGMPHTVHPNVADEIESLRARIDELSRAYAGAGLAIEELTDERDRYREALRPFAALDPYKWGSEERVAILAARAALEQIANPDPNALAHHTVARLALDG